MKAKLNIRDFFDEAETNTGFLLIHASIDVDDLFETNGIDAEQEVDLRELLTRNRLVGHFWCVQDVRALRPDLSDDQAWEVLQECDARLDCRLGISRDSVEFVARDLYGPAPDVNQGDGE